MHGGAATGSAGFDSTAAAGAHSATGAGAATGTHSAAATFTHALCGRHADAHEQHGRGQQEPALSNTVHINLLHCLDALVRTAASNSSQCAKTALVRVSDLGKRCAVAIRSVDAVNRRGRFRFAIKNAVGTS
jgi:hypothetical protein